MGNAKSTKHQPMLSPAAMSKGDTGPEELTEIQELLETLAEILDTTGSGIVWLDERHRVLSTTKSARHVLKEAGVSYEIDQPMAVQNKREDREFQQTLNRAVPPVGVNAVAGSVIVKRRDGLPPLMLRISPVKSGGKPLPISRVAAQVQVVDPQLEIEIDPKVISNALGLTQAEAEVAVFLTNGKTVREIAKSTNREESTIRSHVKRILAKREISRQANLLLSVRSYGVAR